MKILIYIFVVLFALSCNQSTKNSKQSTEHLNEIIVDTVIFNQTITREVKSLAKFNYFGLDKYLFDFETNPANKSFIWKLLVSKNQDWINANSKKLIEKPILPVYRFSEMSVGITTFQKYRKEGERDLVPFTPEYELYNGIPANLSIEHPSLNYRRNRADMLLDTSQMQPILGYSKMDSLNYNKNEEFMIYGISKVAKGRIRDFGYYEDDCDFTFYTYLIDCTEIMTNLNFNPLFATKDPIDLEYLRNAAIDSILHEEYLRTPEDCSARRDTEERVFAKLKGFKNVYFTYRDKFPYNTEIDYPGRSIVIVDIDTKEITRLWHEAIDYFGCACL